VGIDKFLQLWSLGRYWLCQKRKVKPQCKFNICGGGFNFKNADWDKFSELITDEAKQLQHSLKLCRGKRRVDKWAVSLTRLLTDSLRSSTQMPKLSNSAKR
jgi:hypothetical protein